MGWIKIRPNKFLNQNFVRQWLPAKKHMSRFDKSVLIVYLLIAIFAHCVQKFTYDVRPVHFDNDETGTDPQTPIPLES
jgi:hypothetical protein